MVCTDKTPCTAVARIKTRDDKWTPLHFAARYRPRYKDDSAADTEENVTYLSSSKQAVQFLISKCRVDVSKHDEREGAGGGVKESRNTVCCYINFLLG